MILAAVLSVTSLPVLPGACLTAWAYTEQSAAVRATSLNVRSGAGTSYDRTDVLYNGAPVTIVDEVQGSDGNVWAAVRYNGGTGFVQKSYLQTAQAYSHDESFEAHLASQGFPESYRAKLRQVHAQYPSWVFVAQHTGLDWNDAVANESVIGRNLVAKDSKSSWKSIETGAFDWGRNYWPGFDSSAWVAASGQVIRYYMDPRNFLDPSYIFQFLLQSYDAGSQTASGVETMVRGTFMESTASASYGGGSAAPSGGAPGSTAPIGSGPSVTPDGGGSVSGGQPAAQSQSQSQPQPQASSGAAVVSAPPGADGGSGSSGSAGGSAPVANSGSVSSSVPAANSGSVSGSAPGSDSGSAGGSAPAANSGSSGGSAPAASSGSAGSVVGVISGAPTAKAPEILSEGQVFDQLSVQHRAVVGHSSRAYTEPTGGSSGSPISGGGGGSAPSGVNYVDLLMQAAQASGVNPYVLAAMIIQEQGTKGKSGLISGTNSTYPGIYNFFNIMAYEDGSMSAITRGLWWASQQGEYGRPWNSVERAVTGGAQYYGDNYIRTGQDTFYLKKFNVTEHNRYQHQYMTNVEGAADEGYHLSGAYSDAMKAQPLTFRIPVYSNMPDTPEYCPTGDGSPNNRLKNLTVDGFSMNPGFDLFQETYDLTVDSSVGSVWVSAEVIDGSATVTGTGEVPLNGQFTQVTVQVRAGNGDLRNYIINISRQDGGQTGSGRSYGGGSGDGTAGPGGYGPGGEIGPGNPGGSVTPEGQSAGPGGGSVSAGSPGGTSGTVSLVGPS